MRSVFPTLSLSPSVKSKDQADDLSRSLTPVHDSCMNGTISLSHYAAIFVKPYTLTYCALFLDLARLKTRFGRREDWIVDAKISPLHIETCQQEREIIHANHFNGP